MRAFLCHTAPTCLEDLLIEKPPFPGKHHAADAIPPPSSYREQVVLLVTIPAVTIEDKISPIPSVFLFFFFFLFKKNPTLSTIRGIILRMIQQHLDPTSPATDNPPREAVGAGRRRWK